MSISGRDHGAKVVEGKGAPRRRDEVSNMNDEDGALFPPSIWNLSLKGTYREAIVPKWSKWKDNERTVI